MAHAPLPACCELQQSAVKERTDACVQFSLWLCCLLLHIPQDVFGRQPQTYQQTG
jgi:hypothetical protein